MESTDKWNATSYLEVDYTTPVGLIMPIPIGKSQRFFQLAMQFLLSVAIIGANAFILIAIRRSRHLHKVTYYFMGHLATADLLAGVLVFCRFFLILADTLQRLPCLILMGGIIASCGTSILGMLYLSLESYLSVSNMFTFKTVFTPRMAFGLIAFGWLLWIALGMSCAIFSTEGDMLGSQCYIGNGYFSDAYIVSVASVILVMLAVVIYLQLSIFVIVFRHRQKLQSSQSVSLAFQNQQDEMASASQTVPTGTQATTDSSKRRIFIRKYNLAKIIALVLFLFCVCWLPILIALIVSATCPNRCGLSVSVMSNLGIGGLVHSAVNVFVYTVKNAEFREQFKMILCLRNSRVGTA